MACKKIISFCVRKFASQLNFMTTGPRKKAFLFIALWAQNKFLSIILDWLITKPHYYNVNDQIRAWNQLIIYKVLMIMFAKSLDNDIVNSSDCGVARFLTVSCYQSCLYTMSMVWPESYLLRSNSLYGSVWSSRTKFLLGKVMMKWKLALYAQLCIITIIISTL